MYLLHTLIVWRGTFVSVYIAAQLSTLLEQLMEIKTQETGPDRLVREAAQGHTEVVADIVSKHKDKVCLYLINCQ